jgi:hypothetical protein
MPRKQFELNGRAVMSLTDFQVLNNSMTNDNSDHWIIHLSYTVIAEISHSTFFSFPEIGTTTINTTLPLTLHAITPVRLLKSKKLSGCVSGCGVAVTASLC